MLYDNAQLMSLYAEAWQQSGIEEYKKVCYQCFHFLKREMLSDKNYFFSALDADSEGVEGKFYIWKPEEIKDILSDTEYKIAVNYFNINKTGYFEDGNYILLRKKSIKALADELNSNEKELESTIELIREKLLAERNKRVRPGLDDKMLVSWNAMMVRGLADASRVFEDQEMYLTAARCMNFILTECSDETGKLFHSWKDGKASIDGFLEDYAFTIDALIALYSFGFKEDYLLQARDLTFKVLGDFGRTESGFMYFTPDSVNEWVSRQIETSDNVQPASNSVMARNLHFLGTVFGMPAWI
ncbi:MAG: hypothetical protein R2850_13550 [Bacteroidia bacterium]